MRKLAFVIPALACSVVMAQSVRPAPAPAPAPAATQGTQGARFLQSCEQAAEQGLPPPPGCGGGVYRPNEIEQLKQDAIRTRNPQLMTMVGDAYQSPRGGMGDMSQAYRWYVLAAVRGDAQAMGRLSDMYRSGQGAPQDKVKALGYARLSQKMAPAGSAEAQRAGQAVRQLSGSMASREIAMADRFAGEIEQQMTGRAPAPSAASPGAGSLGATRLPGSGAGQQFQPQGMSGMGIPGMAATSGTGMAGTPFAGNGVVNVRGLPGEKSMAIPAQAAAVPATALEPLPSPPAASVSESAPTAPKAPPAPPAYEPPPVPVATPAASAASAPAALQEQTSAPATPQEPASAPEAAAPAPLEPASAASPQ